MFRNICRYYSRFYFSVYDRICKHETNCSHSMSRNTCGLLIVGIFPHREIPNLQSFKLFLLFSKPRRFKLKFTVIKPTLFTYHHVSVEDLANVSQVMLCRLVVCSSNSKPTFLIVCLEFQYMNIRLRQR